MQKKKLMKSIRR